ncbi:13047_t:CDS:2, partial [Entrophospora sp. SA101]
EDTVHYKEHFKYLFKWIDENYKSRSSSNDLYAQVMDFSMAERGGFIEAYIEHKINDSTSYPGDLLKHHKNLLKDEAKKLLKGCQQHFRQSISRISRNHAIIDHTSMTLKLITINNESEFYKHVKSLQERWPLANAWDLSNLFPTSTNAQESMHCCYYLSGATQQSIIT